MRLQKSAGGVEKRDHPADRIRRMNSTEKLSEDARKACTKTARQAPPHN